MTVSLTQGFTAALFKVAFVRENMRSSNNLSVDPAACYWTPVVVTPANNFSLNYSRCVKATSSCFTFLYLSGPGYNPAKADKTAQLILDFCWGKIVGLHDCGISVCWLLDSTYADHIQLQEAQNMALQL